MKLKNILKTTGALHILLGLLIISLLIFSVETIAGKASSETLLLVRGTADVVAASNLGIGFLLIICSSIKDKKSLKKVLSGDNMYGFVAATKTDENFMSQVLEHVLLANGVNFVKKGGTKKQGKALKNSLEFYKVIAKASPPGELFWKQSRELYFAGKTPMIIWSPFIMDELAGLRDSAPPTINSDPTSPELASKTGFITNFSGPNNKKGAAWADVRYFGITADADTDEAKKFIEYSMSEGYTATLGIAPEGKFPVRRGNASDPNAFTKAWSKLPVGVDRKAPLTDLYSADVINNIVAGLDTANRWGVKEGELSRASKIINSQFLNRITREYIDDQISVDEAVKKINAELAKF